MLRTNYSALLSYLISLSLIFVFCLLPYGLAAQSNSVIKIGWSGPLSGNSAVLGVDSLQAVGLAIDKINQAGGINGHSLQLVAEDDQYDTAKAVSAYSKLVLQEGCKLIIANTYGGIFATANRAMKDGVLLINPLDCNDDIARLPESTLCLATQSESVGIAIADEIIKRDDAPIGIFVDQKNPFMLLVEKAVSDRLSSAGLRVRYKAELIPGQADFRTNVLRARQARVGSLIFLGHDTMGQAMSEARRAGIGAQFYTIGTITSPGFQALAGNAAEGVLVAYWEAPRSDKYQQFIEAFKARTGREPILALASLPSYDTAMLLAKSLLSAVSEEGQINIARLLATLYSVKNYQGVSGLITFDPDGAVRSLKERIYEFHNGQLKGAS